LEEARANVSAMCSDPELLNLMQEAGVIVEDIGYWVAED